MTEATEAAQLKVAAMGDLHVKEDHAAPIASCSPRSPARRTCSCSPATSPISASRRRPSSWPRTCAPARSRWSPCSAITTTSAAAPTRSRPILQGAGVSLLDGSSIEIDGVGFVGVKGFAGGFGRRMLGSFGEPAIKHFVAETMNEAMRLENAMRAGARHARDGGPALRADRRDGRGRAAGDLSLPRLVAPRRDHRPLQGQRRRSRPRPSRALRGRTPGGAAGLQRRPAHREADRKPYA